jgi:hypothetical protein
MQDWDEIEEGRPPESLRPRRMTPPHVVLVASALATIRRRVVNRGAEWGRRAIRAAEDG